MTPPAAKTLHGALALGAAATFGLTAWFSVGFHHYDEHFQIVEFAGYLLGWNTAQDLAWEFGARIRPGLQPLLAAGLLRGMSALGIEGPFAQSAGLRLVSAAVLFASAWALARALAPHLRTDTGRRWLHAGAFFLYCIPYISARFSSETWSAAAFMWGVVALGQPRRWLWAGLAWGLAFEFRYQAAMMLVGVGAWLLAVGWGLLKPPAHWPQGRAYWLRLGVLVLGGLAALGVGALADWMLYDAWVFPPWDYFWVNIMEGKAASFGTEPFWWYFRAVLYKDWLAIIASVMMAGVLLFWAVRPAHPLAWATLPFVLLHCAVGHKELRFLFPMAYVVPFMLASAGEWVAGRAAVRRAWQLRAVRLGTRAALGVLLVFNIAVVMALGGRPARGSLLLYDALAGLPPRPTVVYATKWYFLGMAKHTTLPAHFYGQRHAHTVQIPASARATDSVLALPPSDTLRLLARDPADTLRQARFQPLYRPLHPAFWRLNVHNWMRPPQCDWVLYGIIPA